ncbi:thioredoxin-disulfide reductase [Lactiplantibacillus mudanjiangensis]|uniref:Thioredoxin reductase n=1 Tax=Lactiplantibacillus mudanjiangensis TaxID=1296538 RepID=A0A660DYL1_9LACO|nr:thioredoxin-disulfide reductase [Lactiplantibacillus mudanjiangensis]VDG17926.1 thioredoxin reductase (NADPH) [Lactobacillus plantarum JDM1] [Lactiplantibacillus mudanjiangensis]VDG24353.1 thioredoxin reductase (NADPH) [Lactobacillus plantarum JDM1] [Lactiplantibacillus mudanjiangensis]VDG28340.1 thioredoxin reductase (NADPH) [Lactobacillus plantarum JDM1] [Lactiplantibacillus mudanjiangensis]VDG32371.1 thioredoxin reductase (NADPH) [Lactobacillus plantarum JDM1] [Lactiplantibacillus mudanji
MAKRYDVIIIGAGPAGMTAALYASRANLSVLMLDRGIYGGQMNNTAAIENYPGFKSILGPDLAKDMYESSTQFGAEYAYGSVESVEDQGDIKIVKTDSDTFETKAIVIGTGSEYRKLGVTGEETYGGRGVSYCAVCDGAFFRNKHVVVVGGGDSAIEEGTYLTQLAAKVTVIHRRDQLRAQQILQDRAFANDKMEFVWNSNVTEIVGDDKKVTAVKVNNNQTGEDTEIPVDGVFIYVGINPITKPFTNLGITDENGWIETNDHMETKVPGIFAIGDVRKKDLRQVATAVGEGGTAGQQVYSYITALGDKARV